MPYPEYYIGDVKENVVYPEDINPAAPPEELEYSEHLRYSTGSYRNSIDPNSAALKDYNKRYSENSRHSSRLSKGTSAAGSRQSSSSFSHLRQNNRESHGSSSHRHSSSQNGNRRETNITNSTSQSRNSKATNTSSSSSEKTIALFGVNGVTGHYFLQLAVEAGYQVRALILPGFELEDMRENPNLRLIHGTLDDVAKIHRVVRKAAYVVCMLNDCPQAIQSSNTPNEAPSNYAFIRKLVPLMSECSACKVLLYQATSFANDTEGATPMISNVVKKMAVRKTRRETLKEQDRIVKYISKHLQTREEEGSGEPAFQYIITRPSELVRDRPSRKKLAASKSLPGPFPITNIDLAEFSLNALKMENLYNSCPYVVQDGI